MPAAVVIKTQDWPVQVTAVDKREDGSVARTPMLPVPPNSQSEFLCTETRSLIITEEVPTT